LHKAVALTLAAATLTISAPIFAIIYAGGKTNFTFAGGVTAFIGMSILISTVVYIIYRVEDNEE
jgi:hypothetical protein